MTPTLFNATFLLGEDDSLAVDRRVRTLYPSWEYALLSATVETARTTDQTASLANLARQVAHLIRLIRSGGRVINGTDSPIAPNAISTHLNLRAMVKYGMTPYEALSTATRVPAEFLNEPLGRVAPGHYADLVVLGGDPLTDIAQAANVRQVMTNGRLFTVDELLSPYAAAPLAVRAAASVPAAPAESRYWWHDPRWLAESRHACCADSAAG